jgi:hypothetical protein
MFMFMFSKVSWIWCRLWDNVEKYCRTGLAAENNVIRRMLFAYWMAKATEAHSEYVIIIAFPRLQWLRERAAMLSDLVSDHCVVTIVLTSECVLSVTYTS